MNISATVDRLAKRRTFSSESARAIFCHNMAIHLSDLEGMETEEMLHPEAILSSPLLVPSFTPIDIDLGLSTLEDDQLEQVATLAANDINAQSYKYRRTKLIHVIMTTDDAGQRLSLVQECLEQGADPLAIDGGERNAIERAREEGFEEVLKLLNAHLMN